MENLAASSLSLSRAPRLNRRGARFRKLGSLLLGTFALVALAAWLVPAYQRRARLTGAIERASAWLNRPKDSYSTALVWLVKRAASRAELEPLTALSSNMQERAVPDPLSGLIGKTTAQVSLVAEQSDAVHPIDQVIADIAACAKNVEARERFSTFLDEPHTGYLLTHQLLFSIWARELGCQTSVAGENREKRLREKVFIELQAGANYSDLFVERLAVLQLAGHPRAFERRWLEVLLPHQQADGSFQSPIEHTTLAFRGATVEQKLDPVHVTTLALSVLAHSLSAG